MQSHGDYSFNVILSRPRVSSGCYTVTRSNDRNAWSLYITPSGRNRPPKDPSRNRPGKHLVKGVGEIPAAPLGVTHAALDLLAAEGDKVEATALPSLQRQQEVLSTFTPFLFALQRMKKLQHSPRAESYCSVRARAQLPP